MIDRRYRVKNGGSIELTASEVKYLMFDKKKCPRCGAKMNKRKESEIVSGSEINTKSSPMFLDDAVVRKYTYVFECSKCASKFTLSELANRKG